MSTPFISLSDIPKGNVKWIDCRFSLQDPSRGVKQYEQEHVAGAVHWDLEKDLSDMSSELGRHPMPSQSDLKELFERSGLHQNDFIVLYDHGGEPFAPRGWFMLTYANFKNAYILHEGWEELKRSSLPLDSSIAQPVQKQLDIIWNEDIQMSKEQVKAVVSKNSGGLLVDARSEERYFGEYEPIDPIAGRIPGALNYNWERLKEAGRFKKSDPNLKAALKEEEPITVYCGSGVTAAPLFAMLKQSGYSDVKLYVGGFSDWIRTERIEKGRS
ncbi:sulfurtransferase [Chungangia koreensis]|uniref:Sulfurtransferase n=1 Tax=Chungangia koreensis TaxID=752657 RepID=A0ABV8X5Y2_9LACT